MARIVPQRDSAAQIAVPGPLPTSSKLPGVQAGRQISQRRLGFGQVQATVPDFAAIPGAQLFGGAGERRGGMALQGLIHGRA